MRTRILTTSIFALLAQLSARADLWLDVNGPFLAGTGTLAGTIPWFSSVWTSDSSGGGSFPFPTVSGWVNPNSAHLSAGTDGTGTYTLDLAGGTAAVNAIYFEEGSATLANGTFSMGGAGAGFEVASGNTGTINASVSGSVALAKTGAGTLVLGGANTSTGALTIGAGTLRLGGTLATPTVNVNAGTLQLTASERLADTTALTVASVATFDLNGATETIRTLSGSGTAALGGGTLRLNPGAGQTATLSASVTGAGTFSILTGTIALGAAERVSSAAAVTIASGATLDLAGFGETIGALSGGGTVARGAASLTVIVPGGEAVFTGDIAGTGPLQVAGNGIFTLFPSAPLSSTGTLTLSGITLNLGGPAGSAPNNFGGALRSDLVVASGSVVRILANEQIDNTRSVHLDGGTLELVNSSNDPRTESLGTLQLTGGTVQDGGSVPTGTLALAGAGASVTSFASSAGSSISTRLDLGGEARTFTVVDGTADIDLTLSGVIFNGSLVKAGAGRLLLTANLGQNTFAGPLAINAGSVRIASYDVIPDSVVVQIASGASFEIPGFTSDTVGGFTGAGTVALGSGAAFDGSLTVNVAPAALSTFSGAITGNGYLSKSGAGTLLLAGTTTPTPGGTLNFEIADGRLQLGAANAVSSAIQVIVGGAGIFDIGGLSATVGELTGNGTVTGTNFGILTANIAAGATSTFTGQVTNIELKKSGAGTLIVGPTSITRSASIIGGALQLGDGSPASSFTGDFNVSTGTLVFNHSGTATFAGSLNGFPGSALRKEGSGTLILGAGLPGDITTITTTTVAGGTLVVNRPILDASVLSGAALSGNGSLRNLTVKSGGKLAPGDGIGTLTVRSSLFFEAGSTLALEIGSATAYDQILREIGAGQMRINGNVTLTVALGYDPLDGVDQFMISDFGTIMNSGHLVHNGQTLNDGDRFTVNGAGFTQDFQISYGGGQPLVLTAVVPEPGSAALLLGGMGALLAGRRRRDRAR